LWYFFTCAAKIIQLKLLILVYNIYPMFELTGKVALVTGGRRGMGKADAIALAKQGAKVVVTDISEGDCSEVGAEINTLGGESICMKMDVANESEVNEVFDKVIEKYGRLDILVNNAGIYQPKPALELSEDDWEKMIHVNLKGQFICAKRAAKEMIKNKWGRIINISSIASGQVGIGIAGGAHYTASKGGILALTETLAIELAGYGINVNAIAPGAIDTPMISDAGLSGDSLQGLLSTIPLKRMGTPEEIASAVVFLASEEASYITGATLYVDGGWLAS
jgi:NAD(P)-dependent dehydrogenase (short-subunit alcohol dehydrogenase family)